MVSQWFFRTLIYVCRAVPLIGFPFSLPTKRKCRKAYQARKNCHMMRLWKLTIVYALSRTGAFIFLLFSIFADEEKLLNWDTPFVVCFAVGFIWGQLLGLIFYYAKKRMFFEEHYPDILKKEEEEARRSRDGGNGILMAYRWNVFCPILSVFPI